jgi:hypothetical protein
MRRRRRVGQATYGDEKVANRETRVWHGAAENGSLNDGRIQNPSNPFGVVPLSNFVPRGFGFVHHSIAILYHEVPNPNLTIRNFSIAVRRGCGGGGGGGGGAGAGEIE